MRAVVLAGGEGTRLRPLTLTTPKQMLPVAGVPMIERVLGHLASHGVDQAVVSLGYQPAAFLEAYPGGVCAGVKLCFALEDTPLGTAGAIRFAARTAWEHWGGEDKTLVALNGDVMSGLNLSALIAFHRERAAMATVALTPVSDPSRFGVVVTDRLGRVEAFIEKPPAEEAPSNLINAGTYILEAPVIERIPAGRAVSIETEIFPVLAEEGSLYALPSQEWWIDAGTPQAYIEANLRFGGPPPASCDIASSARVVDSVLGEGVQIGARARVSRSVLFDGVRVDEGASVDESIIGRQAHVGVGSIVREFSVVGDRAQVGPGVTLSGERVPLPA
jgi:mannose-1-phosphate guanylyltransferase